MAVDVGSTGGRVYYDGSFDPNGTYFFGAHGGTLTIVVGEEARASFNLATVHGSITSNLRGEAESFRRGERHEFDVGGGGAIVEAETFGGRIRLLRRGSEGAEAPVRRRGPVREDDADLGVALPDLARRVSERVGPAVAARVAPAVAAALTDWAVPDYDYDFDVKTDVQIDVSDAVITDFDFVWKTRTSDAPATIRR